MQNQKQYTALRGQMIHTAMGLGRKLALAQNEQEDARLWLAYHEALEALQQAENEYGRGERSDTSQWDSLYYNKVVALPAEEPVPISALYRMTTENGGFMKDGSVTDIYEEVGGVLKKESVGCQPRLVNLYVK